MAHAEVPGNAREERLRGWIAQYGEAILKTCFFWLADHGRAEDAMQDTFLKAWKHMEAYEKQQVQSDKAWLLRIAVNTCRDYRRSAWLRHTDFSRALEQLPPDLLAVEPDDRTLTLLIGNLPDKYRQVILLYYYHKLSLPETAQVLSLPVSTVHHRLKRAEALLRQEWTGGDSDEA